MAHRTLVMSLFAVALALFVTSARAADKPADDSKSHEGTVVSTEANKLVMTDTAGKEHSHAVGADVKVMLGDKEGKLTDLKKGDKIVVTTANGKVTKISSHAASK